MIYGSIESTVDKPCEGECLNNLTAFGIRKRIVFFHAETPNVIEIADNMQITDREICSFQLKSMQNRRSDNKVLSTSEGSTWLMSQLAIGHNPGPVPFASHFHSLFPFRSILIILSYLLPGLLRSHFPGVSISCPPHTNHMSNSLQPFWVRYHNSTWCFII
jgi:hypothetical protein